MSTRRLRRLCNTRFAPLLISCGLPVLLIVCAESWLRGDKRQNPQPASVDHQLVVVFDINPHQKKVIAVELALAEGIIQNLNQFGNTFSVITFGYEPPALLKSGVGADEAIAALRGVSIERKKDKYSSVHFYDALNQALGQFADDARIKSLLLISEGNDYFPGKTLKQTVTRAEQLHVACDVAMVADHTFYGTKGIQRYGFDLRRLAGETHGQYIEVGGRLKKVPRSVDRFSAGILSRGQSRTYDASPRWQRAISSRHGERSVSSICTTGLDRQQAADYKGDNAERHLSASKPSASCAVSVSLARFRSKPRYIMPPTAV